MLITTPTLYTELLTREANSHCADRDSEESGPPVKHRPINRGIIDTGREKVFDIPSSRSIEHYATTRHDYSACVAYVTRHYVYVAKEKERQIAQKFYVCIKAWT